MTATLYHEVSHQLLFETAGPNAYTKKRRQLLGVRGARHLLRDRLASTRWLARGRRTAGPRIEAAIKVAGRPGQLIPLAEFIALDETPSIASPRSICTTSRPWP